MRLPSGLRGHHEIGPRRHPSLSNPPMQGAHKHALLYEGVLHCPVWKLLLADHAANLKIGPRLLLGELVSARFLAGRHGFRRPIGLVAQTKKKHLDRSKCLISFALGGGC